MCLSTSTMSTPPTRTGPTSWTYQPSGLTAPASGSTSAQFVQLANVRRQSRSFEFAGTAPLLFSFFAGLF